MESFIVRNIVIIAFVICSGISIVMFRRISLGVDIDKMYLLVSSVAAVVLGLVLLFLNKNKK